MRRLRYSLLLALAAFGVGVALVWQRPEPAVVHSEGLTSVSEPGHEMMFYRWELFPSRTEADDEFDTQLQQASDFQEFSPCFGGDGRRTGERALILLHPPHVPRPLWRIMWTYRAGNFSEIFMVESVSQNDARYLEAVVQRDQQHNGQAWKNCKTRYR